MMHAAVNNTMSEVIPKVLLYVLYNRMIKAVVAHATHR